MNSSHDPENRWDVAKTRQLIRQLHGIAQLESAKPSLRSILARMQHAQYHFQEGQSLLRQAIDDRFDRNCFYDAVLLVDVEGSQEIDECLIKVEAHWVASAQAIHALADTLAHFIYFALGLNLPQPWPERDISFRNLIVELKKPGRFPDSYGAVLSELEKLLGAEEFKTIDAFVNHNKHRGIPEPVLAVEPDENRLYAVKHGDFIYRSSPYPSKEIEALLAPAFQAVSRAVVDTGNAVNAALSGQVGMDT